MSIYDQLVPLSKLVIKSDAVLADIDGQDVNPTKVCGQAQELLAKFKVWEQQFKANRQQQEMLKTIIWEDEVLDEKGKPVDKPVLLRDILADVHEMVRKVEKGVRPFMSSFPKAMATGPIATTVALVSPLHSAVASSSSELQQVSLAAKGTLASVSAI